jgi:hypothetical protein
MTCKAFLPMMVVAYFVGTSESVRAEQLNAPVVPVPVVTVIAQPPAPEMPPPPAKPTLRDKLFHGPSHVHSNAFCPGCSSDPDFGCNTLRSQWIFLFGSCRAFYNEARPWK